MHRSRHPIDISLVVDDDNDDDVSHHHFIPSSTTSDYSSLIVNSPSDTMYHRTRSPSPSPTPSMSSNTHTQDPQPTTSTSVRHTHRRFSHSSSLIDSAGHHAHRDRLRFNTWPRHRKEKRDILVEHDKRLGKSVIQELGIGINKTYRNPWGNLSYAQLITRAIDSSPWKRLTLNEVYEWIIKFVPYFKDKIDAKTSWGWKVRRKQRRHARLVSEAECHSVPSSVAVLEIPPHLTLDETRKLLRRTRSSLFIQIRVTEFSSAMPCIFHRTSFFLFF